MSLHARLSLNRFLLLLGAAVSAISMSMPQVLDHEELVQQIHLSSRDAPTDYPRNWAIALFNSFDALDVFGPLDILFYLSFDKELNLHLVAETMDPVWVRPSMLSMNTFNSNVSVSVNPTHTFGQPPADIDVLMVPGGPGVRNSSISPPVVDFIRKTYPRVKYLVTICSGAGLAAQAGVLDGKRATTNKKSWNSTVSMGPKVNWVAPARWTIDGNIWSSSGVTSGLDLMLAFVDAKYGANETEEIQSIIEYNRKTDPCDDPWAAKSHIAPQGQCQPS